MVAYLFKGKDCEGSDCGQGELRRSTANCEPRDGKGEWHKSSEDGGRLESLDRGIKAIGCPPPKEVLFAFVTKCLKEDINASAVRANLPSLLRNDSGEWRWDNSRRTELPMPWMDEEEDSTWADFILKNPRTIEKNRQWIHGAEKMQLSAIIEAKRQTIEQMLQMKDDGTLERQAEPWKVPLRKLKDLFCRQQRLDDAMKHGFLPRWSAPMFETEKDRRGFFFEICRKLGTGNPDVLSRLLDDETRSRQSRSECQEVRAAKSRTSRKVSASSSDAKARVDRNPSKKEWPPARFRVGDIVAMREPELNVRVVRVHDAICSTQKSALCAISPTQTALFPTQTEAFTI